MNHKARPSRAKKDKKIKCSLQGSNQEARPKKAVQANHKINNLFMAEKIKLDI